jgi:hypothetical protein
VLDAGCVIYLEVAFRRGNRNKYLVVLDVDSQVHTLIVNSDINEFYGRGEFGNCYVEISCDEHPFLEHNSFVDCNEVRRLRLEDVVAAVRGDESCVKGRISDGTAAAIVEAIRRTPCLSPAEKDRYCECIEG